MHLANEGRKVCMVFTNATNFVASSSPPPAWLGQSRCVRFSLMRTAVLTMVQIDDALNAL